jgi:hypothetical protein
MKESEREGCCSRERVIQAKFKFRCQLRTNCLGEAGESGAGWISRVIL